MTNVLNDEKGHHRVDQKRDEKRRPRPRKREGDRREDGIPARQ
jgi:hypothetical protein